MLTHPCTITLRLFAVLACLLPQMLSACYGQDIAVITRSAEESIDALNPITVSWKRAIQFHGGVDRLSRLSGANAISIKNLLGDEEAVFKSQDGSLYVRFDYTMIPIVLPPQSVGFSETGGDNATTQDGNSRSAIKAGEPRKKTMEYSFDGRDIYIGYPASPESDSIPTLVVQGLDDAIAARREMGAEFTLWRSDFLAAAGYQVSRQPSRMGSEPTIQSILSQKEESRLSLQKDEGGLIVASLRGVEGSVACWLDPNLKHAVRKWEERDSKGRLVRRSTLGAYQEITSQKGSVWFPHSAVVDHFSWSIPGFEVSPQPDVVFSELYEVNAVSTASIESEAFVVFYSTPGAAVADSRIESGKITDYRMPADRDDLDAVIEHAKSGKRFTPSGLSGNSGYMSLFLIANMVIVAILLFLVYRARVLGK